MINKYQKGDLVRIEMTFVNSAGLQESPGSVWLMVWEPNSIDPASHDVRTLTMTDSMTTDTVGHFFHDYNVYGTGHWKYRWYGTSGIQAAEQGEFKVEEFPA